LTRAQDSVEILVHYMRKHARLWILPFLLGACGGVRGETLRILQAQMLDASDCNVPGTPTARQPSSGTLDVALPDGTFRPYSLPLVVANVLDPTAGSTTFDENDVTLTHFTVALSAPDVVWSDSCPARFDLPLTYRLAPKATAGFAVEAITPSHSHCLLPVVTPEPVVVTATIWAKGVHRGGDVASDPFTFPITVCAGCLQRGYADPAFTPYAYPADIPSCSSLVGANPYPGDVCNPGQDDLISCCAVMTTINGRQQLAAICPGVFTGVAAPGAPDSVDRG
jgi:hypothetical protein